MITRLETGVVNWGREADPYRNISPPMAKWQLLDRIAQGGY
ncbi:MAG TPA: hypothetical protein VEH02_11345 [Pseudolabrys sp.]|nr:hypothetical protein [Pseudolabrys sp.]